MAEHRKRARQRAGDVAQATGLGEWHRFRGDENHVHRSSCSQRGQVFLRHATRVGKGVTWFPTYQVRRERLLIAFSIQRMQRPITRRLS